MLADMNKRRFKSKGHNGAAKPDHSPKPTSKPDHSPKPTDAISQLSGIFVRAVNAVSARTSGPLLVAARAVVYGLVALLAIVATLTLLVAALVRGVDNAVDILFNTDIWLTYFICSAVLGLIAIVLWSKRRP